MSRLASPRMTRRRAGLAAAGVGMLFFSGASGAAATPTPPWSSLLQKGVIVFRGDFPLQQVADDLQSVVPTMLEAPRLLGLSPRRKPVAFYLLADEASFRRYLAANLPGVAYRRSLFLQGRGHSMVFAQRGPQLAVDLRHEATHAALHTLWNEVPLWLDEGLAEYCEAAPDTRVTGHPWLAAVRKSSRQNDLPALENLERKTRAESFTDDDYRSAWAWVHFLINGPAAARERLREYCKAWEQYDSAGRSLADTSLADAAPRQSRPSQPEQLSTQLARRMPDWQRHVQRHFAGE